MMNKQLFFTLGTPKFLHKLHRGKAKTIQIHAFTRTVPPVRNLTSECKNITPAVNNPPFVGPHQNQTSSRKINTRLDLSLNHYKHRSCRLHCARFLHTIYEANQKAYDDGDQGQPPSWLFVSGSVAGRYGAQVNVELDLDERLKGENLSELRENVTARQISFDLDNLIEKLQELRREQLKKENLLSKKEKIIEGFQRLKEQSPDANLQEKTDKLVDDLKTVKKQISEFKPFWDIENEVMLSALEIPNSLHNTTPTGDAVVLKEKESLKEPPEPALSHFELSEKFDLIKFRNVGPKAYYLKKELALAEMSLMDTAMEYLESSNFRSISGPEFVKSPIIEGLGHDLIDHEKVLTMIDPHRDTVEPLEHLTGVSAATFVAFVAKTCIGDAHLPVNFSSCGRRYQKGDDLPGLFGAVQRSQAHIFSCVAEEDVDEHFDLCVDLIWKLAEQLSFPVRLVQTPAHSLERAERRRVELHIFAPSLKKFISLAHVSDFGDFISRRLMTTHNRNHADIRSAKFVHMIHGCALDVTRLLGVWTEYSHTDSSFFRLSKLPI